MSRSTGGVALLGRLLRTLADGPARTVAELARATKTPRSSVFACVRTMEREGLVERDGFRRVLPGAEAARLGLSMFGIGRLQRAAAPLLAVLRDDTNASVDLVAISSAGEEVVLRRRAGWDTRTAIVSTALQDRPQARIQEFPDGRKVVLRLRIHPAIRKDGMKPVLDCLEKVAAALRRELRSDAG